MHESVLPENTREMLVNHDWLVPRYGGEPWLERPPLPQWLSVAVAAVVGRCDAEWIVRLPEVLIACGVVLLAAWLTALWFGRTVGLLSGLILATMYEFFTYASDTEPDIHLCAIVTATLAVFSYLERRRQTGDGESTHFLGGRPWPVLLFFILFGMTNLAKGLIFGTLMAAVPIIGYLLWNRNLPAIRRYCWLWGWLAFAVVSLSWPVAVYARYPGVLELWSSDYFGRLKQEMVPEPVWYYLVNLPIVVLPWTLPALVGLGITASAAFRQRGSPERFLWCWAVLTPAFFSIPHGKHHHYLLQCLVPWAVLASLGVLKLRQIWLDAPGWLRHPGIALLTCALPVDLALVVFAGRFPGPTYLLAGLLVLWPLGVLLLWWGTTRREGRLAAGTLFTLLILCYCVFYSCKTYFYDRYRDDNHFIVQAQGLVRPELPLLVNYDDSPLEAFRLLFYFNGRASLLHNPTYLLDDRITSPEVYVIARNKDRSDLEYYGTVQVILQGESLRSQATTAGPWTLFHLRFHDHVQRCPANLDISPMQATGRKLGPFLGEAPLPRACRERGLGS